MEYNSQQKVSNDRISYYSNNSEYINSDSEISYYDKNEDYNDEDYNENDNNYKYSIGSEYSISHLYDRSSLYTVQVPRYTEDEVEAEDEEGLDPIIDFYFEEYTDNSTIEPVMQLPLSSNQYMLMKQKWNKQLELEMMKQSMKSTKVISWAGFSLSSNNSESDSEHESPIVQRMSDASHYSNQSKKSTRSWKSFFNKFSKKNKKPQIPFYENLVKHV
jgi:hypothetical protein